MRRTQDHLDLLLLLCLPVAIVVFGIGLSVLPQNHAMRTLDILATWTLASLPLGVLIGHCTLSENERR